RHANRLPPPRILRRRHRPLDLNKLTQKSQEAVAAAQALAVERGHNEVDVEHLLSALLAQDDGLVPRLLTRMDAQTESIRAAVESVLDTRPQVSGPGYDPSKVFLTQRLGKVLVEAEKQAKRLKDEDVSVEHLMTAMLEDAKVGKLLQQFGITHGRFLKALTDVRGNQREQSANPEATYEALERYGRDLVK